MIGTEFLNGQGLGNQLFCYISARAIALKNNCEFGTANQQQFANNIHSNRGMYFMDIDLGEEIIDKSVYHQYHEIDFRAFFPNCRHDRTHGCSVSGADINLLRGVKDNTLLYGNLQDESYFSEYKTEIKKWLRIKDEYNSYRLTKDNLCVINMRGSEYTGSYMMMPKRDYYQNAMKVMKGIRPDMRFVIITEDIQTANIILPGIKAVHLGMGEDYVAVHNARYLILSFSSFSFFPAYTSDTVKFVIAPKYWARYSSSNGYWGMEQNIYSGWTYMDRWGKLFTAEECRKELNDYKSKHSFIDISNMSDFQKNGVNTLYFKYREGAYQSIFRAKKAIFRIRSRGND